MNDDWLCVDEDSTYSDSSYSDKVDSEVEAELYSIIHHQETVSNETFSKLNNNESIGSISTNHCNENDTRSFDESDTNVKFDQSDSNSNNKMKQPNQSDSNSNNKMKQPNASPRSEELEGKNFQKFSSLLKHKFNFESSMSFTSSEEESLNSSTLGMNKDVNRESREYSHRNIISRKKGKSSMYSSDSDSSVIWSEPNTSKANIKTNLLDTISLSSESMDSLVISPSKTKMTVHNNSSAYCSPQKRTFEDLWSINDEDFYRRRNSKRYHSFVERCSLCKQRGHMARSCSVLKGRRCFICGGSHTAFECNNIACSKCYETGHDFRNCRMTIISHCYHCRMKGHVRKNCPDKWRRYHLTTESEEIVRGEELKQNSPIYCFNCGWPDHFGSVCDEPRYVRGSSYPTWPAVISYSNPSYLLNERSAFTPDTSVMRNKLSKKLSPKNMSQNALCFGENTPKKFASPLKEATSTQSGAFKMSDFLAEREKLLAMPKKKKKTKNSKKKRGDKGFLTSQEEYFKVRYGNLNFPRTAKRNCNVNNNILQSVINSEISPFPRFINKRPSISVSNEDDEQLPRSLQLHLLRKKKVQMKEIKQMKRKIKKIANKAKRLKVKKQKRKSHY